MADNKKKLVEDITPMDVDFAKWYTDIVRKADLAVQHGDDAHYRIFCYYTNAPDRNFELFQLEMDPGHRYESIGHPEKAQEFIMVFAGCLELTANGLTHTLRQDDAIGFVRAPGKPACGQIGDLTLLKRDRVAGGVL